MIERDKISVISWDVDGTLYDSKRFKQVLFNSWLKTIWNWRSWYDLFFIISFQNHVKKLRSQKNQAFDSHSQMRLKIEKLEEKWFAPALKQVGPRPGIKEVIRHLQSEKIMQVVVSDFRSLYKLKALGLENCFQKIYACENSGFFKPDPAIFLDLLNDFRIESWQLLHIGDRDDTDGLAAKAIGCRFYLAEEGDEITLPTVWDNSKIYE